MSCWRTCARCQEQLREDASDSPRLCAQYFDPRLLDVPLFRVGPRDALPDGVVALWAKDDRKRLGRAGKADAILADAVVRGRRRRPGGSTA